MSGYQFIISPFAQVFMAPAANASAKRSAGAFTGWSMGATAYTGMVFSGGSACLLGSRATTVFLSCNATGTLVSKPVEVALCSYAVNVSSPESCGVDFLLGDEAASVTATLTPTTTFSAGYSSTGTGSPTRSNTATVTPSKTAAATPTPTKGWAAAPALAPGPPAFIAALSGNTWWVSVNNNNYSFPFWGGTAYQGTSSLGTLAGWRTLNGAYVAAIWTGGLTCGSPYGNREASVVFTCGLAATPALTFICAIGAALTAGMRRGGLILSVLVMPLMIPILIFGISATSAALGGTIPFMTPFSILIALTLFAFVSGTVAATLAIQNAEG